MSRKEKIQQVIDNLKANMNENNSDMYQRIIWLYETIMKKC